MTETILVTGSSRGIGRAIALRLARSGYDIVLHCRSRRDEAEAVQAQIAELGQQARILQFDVSDRAACREALEADVEQHGAYYGVVCNAGLTRDGAFPALSDEDWDQVLRTNLDGFYNVLHPLTMPMIRRRKAGRIVCITSVSGLIGNRGQVNYSASKAGVIGAAKALAIELGKRKITVNCVAPGLIDTEILDDLLGDERIQDGRMGVACGSSTGSTDEIKAFGNMLLNSVADGLNANSYIRMMPHTTAANISIFFGLKGRLIPTSSACTSGSQGIGYAYEAIKFGRLKMMLAGGAEELCPTEAMVFDALYATSLKNDTPHLSPRPYDAGRDGLVIGEGAGILVLEELEHALARGATIHAEIVGFGCNSDGIHATKPEQATMRGAMELALEDAGLEPSAIGYVNGHGTATAQGDVAESLATNSLFGPNMPISSQKSFFGHTLGACGALESWFSIEMMNSDSYVYTLNLDNVDPECGELDYLRGEFRQMSHQYVMNNNFAFGGVNTSLIFKRWN